MEKAWGCWWGTSGVYTTLASRSWEPDQRRKAKAPSLHTSVLRERHTVTVAVIASSAQGFHYRTQNTSDSWRKTSESRTPLSLLEVSGKATRKNTECGTFWIFFPPFRTKKSLHSSVYWFGPGPLFHVILTTACGMKRFLHTENTGQEDKHPVWHYTSINIWHQLGLM